MKEGAIEQIGASHNLSAKVQIKHVPLQTNYCDMANDSFKIKDWIDDRQKHGQITFLFREVVARFPAITEQAVKNALNRLVNQDVIISVRKGFYVIVPVEYALRGLVPPEAYINELMGFLGRPYYVALLNAAAFYGAAHQRPQQLSVVCGFPFLRDAKTQKTRINFVVTRKNIPQKWLKTFRTESDDIQVSTPELTAADLITFQKEIGGLNRASTVLVELSEVLNFNKLDKVFFDYVPIASIQRLGYLLENELEQPKQAEILYAKALKAGCKLQKIPLKCSKKTDGYKTDTKWKIIINEQIETDV
ncbi:MAG: type IV toxin-antitoxin system AbiEi family antitoxin [Tannerellaceae bacterium]|nr:type IV toxin-antitoxin system AbiEi family antitoxin [Tannerellaceae bacterium]